jgi:hypothetical protein
MATRIIRAHLTFVRRFWSDRVKSKCSFRAGVAVYFNSCTDPSSWANINSMLKGLVVTFDNENRLSDGICVAPHDGCCTAAKLPAVFLDCFTQEC